MSVYKNQSCLFGCLFFMRSYTPHPIAMQLCMVIQANPSGFWSLIKVLGFLGFAPLDFEITNVNLMEE